MEFTITRKELDQKGEGMKKREALVKAYGVLFLTVGLVWLGSIYIRSEGYLSRPKAGATVSYQDIQTQLAERIQANETRLKIKGFSLKKHLPEVFVVQFWMIAAGEFLCAILFLVAGFSLLRGYPLHCLIAVVALGTDLVLKFLVWSYQQCILMPLKDIFDGKNILLMYFTPDTGLAAKVAAFLAGIPVIRPGALYYGLFYAAFWAVSLWILTNPERKKHS